LNQFDAVVIHYSLRLAYGVIHKKLFNRIKQFSGLKILFLQDEYDFTERTRCAFDALNVQIVFTCVPEDKQELIYPKDRFPKTSFVETLTGFAPEMAANASTPRKISDRTIMIGYRGRALPFWYGDLGQEKQIIAEVVKRECLVKGISCDIEWEDQERIYGEEWTEFQQRCKSTLGTESGSNLFDDDGSLRSKFSDYQVKHPDTTYTEARSAVLGEYQESTIMNQISPRVFEAIANKTALVLFEGNYSGIIKPDLHYISLKKNFSNLEQVFEKLSDDRLLQEIVDRAYDEIIGCGQYTFKHFIDSFDELISTVVADRKTSRKGSIRYTREVTAQPRRNSFAQPPDMMTFFWRLIPTNYRMKLTPVARRLWSLLNYND